MLDFLPRIRTDRRLQGAKLIACDLDGTLLGGDERVAASTASLIGRVLSSGIGFVIITARHHRAVTPYVGMLADDQPIVSLDGAMTVMPGVETPSSTIAFDQRLAHEVVDMIGRTDGVEWCAVTPRGLHESMAEMPLPSRYGHWRDDALAGPLMEGDEVLEIIAAGNFFAVNEVFNTVERGGRRSALKLRIYESRSSADTWFLEVRSARATKVRALENLISALNVSMRSVIGIGDHHNDVDFCRRAGYSVAVRNAVDELKDRADFVTRGDCLEHGIDEFLDHLLRTTA